MKFYLKLTLIVSIALSVGCSSIKKSLNETADKNQYHIGFYLVDPETGKELINVNGDKYFTPASNTKILTLYAAITTLGDSIPAFEYQVQDSVIQIWPSGDPSLLYYSLPENKTIAYLSSFDTVKISNAYFHEDRFGPGWSWEDYAYSYSPERSVFPIYGNVVEFNKDSLTNQLAVMPNLFADSVEVEEYGDFNVKREEQTNVFHIELGDCADCERLRPFLVSDATTIKLLEDTIKTTAYFNQVAKGLELKIFYSQLSDSVYKHMMQESDNFIAEQLLLLVAGQLTDTLSSEIAIDTISQRMNTFLPDSMNWVDGSGLSRYNLFTPRSVVALWKELIRLYGQERLMQIIAVGGVAGTIENYYQAEPPYIYGKTGTLSNNHNLSGMLLTKSGKTLLFSFMNNNYPGSSSGIKKEMEQILMEVHEKY
jgi:D-alanyl-D-alanine carboxypeptidase/D-alanyl-D-alanine-endopeptidase (penicillin-binding protein 4)